ncbi:MAG: ribonuclease HII [Parcubacteria group bacterium]|nr:ribonuclease HII [Parcubacteria group bacterium]
MKHKYIIGIDEAGRGPLAGPVSVGAVLFLKEEYEKFVAGKGLSSGSEADGGETLRSNNLKDSKKLSEKKREEWFENMQELPLESAVAFSSNKVIDTKGIIPAINMAIEKIFVSFNKNPEECLVLLDGNLKAPKEFKNQETIVKGDEKEPVISLASIVAKVSRDRYIVDLAKKYPEYNFDKHKGYGTKLHYEMLKKHGLCNIHRRSFLKKLLN